MSTDHGYGCVFLFLCYLFVDFKFISKTSSRDLKSFRHLFRGVSCLWVIPSCLFSYFVGRRWWNRGGDPSRVSVLPVRERLFSIRPPGVVGDKGDFCGRQERRSLRVIRNVRDSGQTLLQTLSVPM